MIPIISEIVEEITEVTYPTKTYKINFAKDINQLHSLALVGDGSLTVASTNALSGFLIDENGVVTISYNANNSGFQLTQDGNGVLGLTLSTDIADMDRISGFIDDLDSVVQAVYLILSTERYEFIIYSWDYGVELLDLYGKPMPYVMAELPNRIKEALTQDDRIEDVIDFEFIRNGRELRTTFTIVTNIGSISTALEVKV
jgi:hypothetical protein